MWVGDRLYHSATVAHPARMPTRRTKASPVLVPELHAEIEPLGPEVRAVEGKGRPGGAYQGRRPGRRRDLAGVERPVERVPRAGDVAPVQERVAHVRLQVVVETV